MYADRYVGLFMQLCIYLFMNAGIWKCIIFLYMCLCLTPWWEKRCSEMYSGTAAPAYLLLVTLAVSRSGGYED